jgi:hypothetical protein
VFVVELCLPVRDDLPPFVASQQFVLTKEPDEVRFLVVGRREDVGHDADGVVAAAAGVRLDGLQQWAPLVAHDQVQAAHRDDEFVTGVEDEVAHVLHEAVEVKAALGGELLGLSDADRGEVHAGDAASLLGQVERVPPIAAAEVEGARSRR